MNELSTVRSDFPAPHAGASESSHPILEYGCGAGRRSFKTGPRGTIAVMALPLVPLAWLTIGLPPIPMSPLWRLLSGRLFADRVVPWEEAIYHTLTPFVVRDFFQYFAIIAVPTLAYVAAARWLSDRSTPGGRRAFAVPAVAICACLVVLLTIPFAWLVQYTTSMGLTQARANGLLCGVAGYAVILAFAWWSVRGGPTQSRHP